MQQPQTNQPSVSTQMHSVYTRGEQLNNQKQLGRHAQSSTQFNLSDTNDSQSTWQWRNRNQDHQTVEDQPAIVYVPDNGDSFAPPANLNDLQRVEQPIAQQPSNEPYLGEIYKSPLDLYRSRAEVGKENLLDSPKSEVRSTPPHDTKTNGSHGFVSRDSQSRMLFEHTESEEVQPKFTAAGKPLIRLKSQSSDQIQLLKKTVEKTPKAQETPIVTQQEPTLARLLVPDFESFQGSPQLTSPGQRDDQWSPPPAKAIEQAHQLKTDSNVGSSEWVTFSPPQPAEVVAPPAAIFQSLAPPAPVVKKIFTNQSAFDSSIEHVAPPSFEPPAPKPSAQITSVSSVNQSDFVGRSEASVFKPVSSVRVVDQPPVPKLNFEAHRSWASHDETSHVASTIQPAPINHEPLPMESGWLSPWWILAGLIPFAIYVAMRGSEEETFDDYDLSESPSLSPEMLRQPGYSKSDPVYGEDELVLAVPVVHPPKGQSFPAAVEVNQNSSPNFRRKKKRT